MNTKVVVLRSRIAQCLIALTVVVCLLATAAPALAQTTTALFLDSQPGDWVGAGIQRTVTPATHTFQVTRGFRQGVTVDLVGPGFSRWGLDFAATDNIPLQPGEYGGATRASFTQFNGIDVGGDGRGCNHTTGRFVVHEIVYGALGAVDRLAIDFEQHCEDGAPGLYGALRFNSTISTLVPFGGAYPSYVMRVSPGPNGVVTGAGLECRVNGPVCAVSFPAPTTATFTATPDPGYIFAGWSPPCFGSKTIAIFVNTEKTCQALFTPVTPSSPTTIMWWNSRMGDFAFREVFTSINSRWALQRVDSGNQVWVDVDSVDGRHGTWWTLIFKGPGGQNQPLAPGTYTFLSSDLGPNRVDSDAFGSGVFCSITGGSFVVHEIEIMSNAVTRLAIDFEHECASHLPGRQVGSIRFNSLLPPRATLALDLSGQGQVELSPSGQVCSGDCWESAAPGTGVQFAPTPGAAHWMFPGWSGDADCAEGVVTLDAPTLCAASFQAIVTADSVTPNAGTGTTQTFTFRYSSPIGHADLTSVRLRFGASNVGPGTCTASYNPVAGVMSLLNDAGTAWQTWASLFGSIGNGQCILNLGASSVTRVGNVVTLNLNITFDPSFVGLKQIYMLATGATGSNTGWHQRGTWTPAADPTIAVVDALSTSPSAGSGATQAFTLQYSDSLGASDLSSARVRFGASNVGPGTCTVWYDATTATIKLMSDAGVWGAPVALGSGTLANSQCTLNLASSTATPSGNTLTLVLQLTFAGGFTGLKNIYMLAGSATGPSSGWIQRGTWTPNVGGPAVVNPASVTPSSGSGATQAFTLQYTDSLGANDLSSARVRFGATNVGPGTCTIWYDATTATIKLMDDGGVWGAPVALGSGTLANSQCTLNLASSTATPNGNALTLVLQITFAGGFTGLKNIYMLAASATGPNSGWIQRGTWTPNVVVGPAAVNAVSVSPNAGSGATQAFTLQYTDSLGASDLSSARVRFGAANVGPGTCTVWYDATANTIKLMDDAGVWGTPVALGSGTLANRQCTLNLAATSATPSGNDLTLVLNIAFSGNFAGPKTIFMLAASAGGVNSGWQTRGTWDVPAALLRDDFIGSALDTGNWFLPAGVGTFLGRTQLRPPSESLEVANGVVRLRLDTYNPTALVPGDSFWGSEIVSNAIFGRGAGLTFSARARLAGPVPGGLVASVFSYMTQSGVHDEIDVELLSNDLAAPRLLTNVFDDNDFSHPGYPVFATIPGFSLTDFNLYQVDWLPDRVRWRINGIVVREDLVNVPDDPMSIRLNLWAPASTFAAAYHASLQPADNPAANQTFYYDVDYVEVREAP